jgi:predicted TIM-barrel fold metal-dependent hydrolase
MSDINIPLCKPPDREPRKAQLQVPAGATDCHTHLFGPVETYPYIHHRGYTPPDSSLAEMLHMHAQLGIERVVFTQPSVYGTNNSAILDATRQVPEHARAIVALDMHVSDEQLEQLDSWGVRGVRLNMHTKGGMPIPLDDITRLADRIKEVGWHMEFLFAGEQLDSIEVLLRALPVWVSIAHFAFMPVAPGVAYPPFQKLLRLLTEGNVWIKLSAPYRLSSTPLPPYTDLTPMAQALVAANPERVLWASDWPHPNCYGEVPNDADLLEALGVWVPDTTLRNRILVDNPQIIYRF